MPNSEGRWLTTPLKVWCHWRLTMQQEIAWCSWLVRTGLQGACQAAIKWWMEVVYASYSLRTRETITESVVRESTELAVNERIDWDGKWMAMAMSDVLIVLFISLPHFWFIFQKWSSFALPWHACSTCNFASATPNFHLIRAVRFLSRV